MFFTTACSDTPLCGNSPHAGTTKCRSKGCIAVVHGGSMGERCVVTSVPWLSQLTTDVDDDIQEMARGSAE